MFVVLRFLLRLTGCFLLAAGVVAFVSDGSRAIAQSKIVIVSAGELLGSIAPGAMASLKDVLLSGSAPFLWDPLLISLLSWPAWLLFAVLGFAALWLGKRHQRRRPAYAF